MVRPPIRRAARLASGNREIRTKHRTTVSTVLAALVALVLGAACGTSATLANDGLRGVVRGDPLAVGDVTLPDVTSGAEVPFELRAAPGELLIVYFGFTFCPDVCPTTLADLRTALGDLGEDAARVRVAMVTVDPERDTPDVLTRYLGFFAERPVALRPASDEQLRAAEEAFLASSEISREADGQVHVSHTATTYVVGEAGTVLVEWPFGLPAEDMAHDLDVLLARGDSENA